MKSVRVVMLMVYALALAACGGGDKKLELGGSCSLNSDCADGLLCKFGACHKACVKSVDCASGERCVQVDSVTVCQTVKEAACGTGCPAPLMCRQVDNTCRNKCTTADDCLGAQTCSATFCIENKENTPATGLDGGAADAGTTSDAPLVSPDVPLVTPDATLVAPDATLIDAPAKDVAITPIDTAKLDTTPSSICTPACTPGQECVTGTCQPCGRTAGQPCCAGTCNTNLTCNTANNQCACGGQDQACCSGTTCNTGLGCKNASCSCGDFGFACCAGATCTSGGVCAGLRCGCVKSCEDGFYRKVDDTIHGAFALTNADGSTLLKATSVAIGYAPAACIVADDGTVWCQGDNGGGQLGCGDSTITSSSKMVQVLTGPAPSGTPLGGIVKVASSSRFGAVCALSTAHTVWCWGRGTDGELGTGSKLNSSFALPVVDAPGGSPIADVVELAVGTLHACVTKGDGSVWCWGSNDAGHLGTGSAGNSLNPAKVVGMTDPAIALSLSDYYAAGTSGTCAIDSKKSVWCWGRYAGPDGAAGANLSAVRLAVAKNGAAFTDAVQVDATNQRVRKSDGSLWYWTDTAVLPATENSIPVAGSFYLGRGCWIGADGALRGITNPICP